MIKINPQVENLCNEEDFYYFLQLPENINQSCSTLYRCHEKYSDDFLKVKEIDRRDVLDITNFITCDFKTINMLFPGIREEKMWENILSSHNKLLSHGCQDIDYDYVSPL